MAPLHRRQALYAIMVGVCGAGLPGGVALAQNPPPPTHAVLHARYNHFFDQNGRRQRNSKDVAVAIWEDLNFRRQVGLFLLKPNGVVRPMRVRVRPGINEYYTTAAYMIRPNQGVQMRSPSGDPVFVWRFEVFLNNRRQWAIREPHPRVELNVNLQRQQFTMTRAGDDGVRVVR